MIEQNLFNYNLLFSGLMASVISVVITSVINIIYQKKTEKKQLSDTLMQLNAFVINEPFLLNDAALERYITENEKENEAKRDKYDIYCIMKWNYLANFCQYYNFNLKKIKEHLNIKEYITDHEKWFADK